MESSRSENQQQPKTAMQLPLMELQQELAPHFTFMEVPEFAKTWKMLQQTPTTIVLEECVNATKNRLEEAQEKHSENVCEEALSLVLRGYPDTYGDEKIIPSPKHYLKETGAPTEIRQQLNDARNSVIFESEGNIRQRFTEEISDNLPLQPIASDEEINDRAKEIIQSRINSVFESALNLKSTAHKKNTYSPEVSPPLAQQASPGKRLNIFADNNPIPPMGTSFDDAIYYKNSLTPQTREEMDQVIEAIKLLNTALKDFQGLTPEKVADLVVAGIFSESTEEDSKNKIQAIHYCSRIALEELHKLGNNIQEVYDNVPRSREEHVIDQASNKRKHQTIEPSEEIEEMPQAEKFVEVHTEALGKVSLDLPWTDQEEFSLELMRQNGYQLLVIDAKSPKAKALSEELRNKNPKTIRTFDNLWQKAKETVLTHPLNKHHKKVRNLNNKDYDDVSVMYSGNITHNAKRVYYGKACANKFKPLVDMITKHKLSPDISVLFLLAETDKKHQLKTYKDVFNVSRAQASAGGAGS